MIDIALKLCLLLLSCPNPSPPYVPPHSGFLSAYAQIPTDATIEYQQEIGKIPLDLSAYDGVIAVYDCSLVGETAVLHTIDGDPVVMIFDCAGELDGGQAWMREGRYVAEMGYYLWQSRPELLGTWAELAMEDN